MKGELKRVNSIFIIFMGLGISLVLSVLLLLLYATILTNTNIQENTIKPVVMVICGVSILVGSTISSLKLKKKGILVGMCIGALYFSILYVFSSIAFIGFSLNPSALILIFTGLFLGAVGGALGVATIHS